MPGPFVQGPWIAGRETTLALPSGRRGCLGGGFENRAGPVARQPEAVSRTAVSMELMISRRAPARPGTGAGFLAPSRGPEAVRATLSVALSPRTSTATRRIDGPGCSRGGP